MKKIAMVLLMISIVCMTACGTKSTLSDFEELVKQGKYTEALELYTEKGADDYSISSAMSDVLKNVAEQAINEYLNDTIDYEEAQKLVDTVKRVSGNRYMVDEETMTDYNNRLSEANASKVAYDSGKSLLEDKNYTGAVEQFKKVAKNDSRYNEAQQQIVNAVKAHKEDVTEKAKKCADEGKYDEADSMLTEALTLMPDDTDLLTLKGTYSANYISQVIEQANAAFATPKIDYEKSLNIIKTAMQKYPEDTKLKEKYDYYMGFEPISIFTMKPYTYNGNINIYDNETDTLGNNYEKAFSMSGPTSDKGAWKTYSINKKFNLINGVLSICEGSGSLSSGKGCFYIYGDDKLLYKKTGIVGSCKPEKISVNITGVTDLKIYCNNDWYSPTYLFANVTLQKTTK